MSERMTDALFLWFSIYKTLVLKPILLSKGYIHKRLIQQSIGMSSEDHFRSVKKYYRHESVNEMVRHLAEFLFYYIFLIKNMHS